MAAIYLHIPFCKSRCAYCNFYSTVAREDKQITFVNALFEEISNRAKDFSNQTIDTIYFGGGTPSVLIFDHLLTILKTIKCFYQLNRNAEITIEVNPDDITPSYAENLLSIGINRVSMGVQSLDNQQLKLINRRHDAATAIKAVYTLRNAGFQNISIDLIYGLPNQNLTNWKQILRKALSLPITHLSAYALSYEPGTLLSKLQEKGDIKEVSEGIEQAMYIALQSEIKKHGFYQYETSNFALPTYESKHNQAYWQCKPYMGFGPAAHSYDGLRYRRWNYSNLNSYLLLSSEACEFETLNNEQLLDELFLTTLRTHQGTPLSKLNPLATPRQKLHILKTIHQLKHQGLVNITKGHLQLNPAKHFIADNIIAQICSRI